jgi:hypothetical protein
MSIAIAIDVSRLLRSPLRGGAGGCAGALDAIGGALALTVGDGAIVGTSGGCGAGVAAQANVRAQARAKRGRRITQGAWGRTRGALKQNRLRYPRDVHDVPTATTAGAFRLARVRLARWLGRLGMLSLSAPLVLAIVEIVAHPWGDAAWLSVWRTALLAGPLLAIGFGGAAAATAAVKSVVARAVRVDGKELVLERDGGERRMPLADVRSGVVVPPVFGRSARVEIELRSGDRIVGDIDGVAAGERLLASAGVDATQRRCEVPLFPAARAALRRGFSIFGTIMVSLFTLGVIVGDSKGGAASPFAAIAWLVLTTAAVAAAARAFRPKSLTIGADGIVVQRFGRDRFIRFADIASVTADGKSLLTITLTANERIRVRADDGAAAAISKRVAEVRAQVGDAPVAEARREVLARGGRTLAAWREALARLVQDASAYRAAAMSEDDLAALMTSPNAEPEHRIGAALALAAGGDAPKERVRVAASDCASPRMRVALERIADGHDDERAVEEALEDEAARRA